eukprot:COSAG01_NODE_2290_length_7984_cov_10.803424_8_plen_78_part_00
MRSITASRAGPVLSALGAHGVLRQLSVERGVWFGLRFRGFVSWQLSVERGQRCAHRTVCARSQRISVATSPNTSPSP